jgi:hypothetical protein
MQVLLTEVHVAQKAESLCTFGMMAWKNQSFVVGRELMNVRLALRAPLGNHVAAIV